MLHTIGHFGYIGVFVTILLETGFMIFPLPGDTLLFTSGILSDSKVLNFELVLLIAFFASSIGGQIGYFIGTKIDKEVLLNNKIYKIKHSYIEKTENFFGKYGFYAILFSRFIPVVRNFISQLMGIINYDKKKFFWANLGASVIWPFVIIGLGNLLGKMFPHLISYAEYGMLFVLIFLSFPVIYEFVKLKKD